MLSILNHDLKYYFRNKQEAIYLYSYFISIVLLIPFANKAGTLAYQDLAPMTLWVALASAVALGGSSLFTRDWHQGRLEYYQLLPVSMEAMVFAKWLGFLAFILVPLLAALPVAGLLFNLAGGHMLHYAVGLGAGAIALSVVSTLVAAITSGMGKAGAILSLAMLPLTIPVIIFGAQYCRDMSALWQPNLLFLLGLSFFLLPIMCFVGAHSIRASN
jgi:heme exporter protein B